jgi:hypothetical protein
VVEQYLRFMLAHQLRRFSRDLAVGQLDARNHLSGERAAGVEAERERAGAGRGEIQLILGQRPSPIVASERVLALLIASRLR